MKTANKGQPKPVTLIFDFDGTLADTIQLSFTIYNELATEFGCRPVNENERELLRMRRPQDFFREYGMTLFKMPRFAERVRSEISRRLSDIVLFDGVAAVLRQLNADGFTLGIISSNTEENIRRFLRMQTIEDLFDFVWCGRNLFGKALVIKKCMKKRGIDSKNAVYIGDETRDVEAAGRSGIPMIAVTWGYSAAAMLETLMPEVLVNTPDELYSWIRGRFGNAGIG